MTLITTARMLYIRGKRLWASQAISYILQIKNINHVFQSAKIKKKTAHIQRVYCLASDLECIYKMKESIRKLQVQRLICNKTFIP